MTRSALIASRERPFHKRIRLACTFCRKRKVRCDGGSPCSFCRHLGTEPCVYAEVKQAPNTNNKGKASTTLSSQKKNSKKPSVKREQSPVQLDAASCSSSSSSPMCSFSPCSSSSSSSSASSSSSIDFDSNGLDNSILPTVQIQHWQDYNSFTNLTAEFTQENNNNIKEEEEDTTIMGASLYPSLDYLNTTSDYLWSSHSMIQGTSMSSSSFTTSPSSSTFSASPLSTQFLSPHWNNTHHWTNHYLDDNTTTTITSYLNLETNNDNFSLSSPTDSMLAGDALGLCLGGTVNNTFSISNMSPSTSSNNAISLSYSSMADSNLFRRRALAYLSQIDCQ